MASRKLPDDYHSLAKKRGFHWNGPEVRNTQTKKTWQCKEGHKWEAIYNNINRGRGCPFCSGRVPKTDSDYISLALESGIKWIGPLTRSTHDKTTWQCSKGHKWDAPFFSIKYGYSCPHCAGVYPKLPKDYHLLAIKRGFNWIGPEVRGAHKKTFWECSFGHQWEANYSNIHQGRGCPYCSGKAQKKPDDYHELAYTRGFAWIGPEVSAISDKTFWHCSEGHNFETTYAGIFKGTKCPYCTNRLPKTPDDYLALARRRDFKWLGPEVKRVDSKTSWQCKKFHEWESTYSKINLGSGCPYCAGVAPKDANDYHNLAATRSYEWLGPMVDRVIFKTSWKCHNGHQWESRYHDIQQGKGCPYCAGSIPKEPEDYIKLADNVGFDWLGPEVSSTHTKTHWQCPEGHAWSATYQKIASGRGCPTCIDRVNGAQVSRVQRNLFEILGGQLNYRQLNYNIDIAIERSSRKIAIEYDSWYWHGGREEYDSQRDQDLINSGWSILRIRSNTKIPPFHQLDSAIKRLISGETRVEIVLDDWGIGPAKFINFA